MVSGPDLSSNKGLVEVGEMDVPGGRDRMGRTGGEGRTLRSGRDETRQEDPEDSLRTSVPWARGTDAWSDGTGKSSMRSGVGEIAKGFT